MNTDLQRFSVLAVTFSCLTVATPAGAQLGEKDGPRASIETQKDLKLSSGQKRTIYQAIVNEEGQLVPTGEPLTVGVQAPKALRLMELPHVVQSQVPSVRNYQFAKLTNGNVILVEKKNRRVAEVVTKEEGSLKRFSE